MSCSFLVDVAGVAAVAAVAMLEAAPAVDEAMVLAAAHAVARLPARPQADLKHDVAHQLIESFVNRQHLITCTRIIYFSCIISVF